MDLSLTNILGVLVVIVILYVLYSYFFSSSKQTLAAMKDAKTSYTVPAGSLSPGQSNDYTYSIWLYIDEWNYRFGEEKVVFQRQDAQGDPAPKVALSPSINNLEVIVSTYPDSNSNNVIQHKCNITDVPIQSWTNIILALNNRALDVYMDGRLVRTCVLPGVAKAAGTAGIVVTPGGGFSGYTSKFEYLPYAVNPQEAYSIYTEGNGSGSVLGGIFDKYQVKLSFVEDNREVHSVSI
jgi:Concanavalin A-like lectin/glucanases superfamily